MKQNILKRISIVFGAMMAVMLSSCESPIGEASLVEGAWMVKTCTSDKSVSADQQGNTHLNDNEYTYTYKDKELAWLFYQGYISWWSGYEDNGNDLWSPWAGDMSIMYTVEGEGKNLVIVTETRSTIPGECGTPSVLRYKVEKLTSKEMTLSCNEEMYVSDLKSTVDVHVTYTFVREQSLMDFVNAYIKWEKENNGSSE